MIKTFASKIKLKDVDKSTLVIPYLLTIVWLCSFIGLIFAKTLSTQFFLGVIALTGFIILLTRGKNLKHLKVANGWLELSFFPEKKTK